MKNICHNFYRTIIFNASALRMQAVRHTDVSYKFTAINGKHSASPVFLSKL